MSIKAWLEGFFFKNPVKEPKYAEADEIPQEIWEEAFQKVRTQHNSDPIEYERYDRLLNEQTAYHEFERAMTNFAQSAFHAATTVEEVTAYRNAVLMIRCAARDCWKALGREVPPRLSFIDDTSDTPNTQVRRHDD